ncbi:MAG: glutathione S-transferase family protein [Alphaproteobacteria bacterium]|nr:glutathione S-transferase family protein [Alphaproteobacteria bacterium]
MITLYAKATSNGRKASIMLEETGLDYEVRPMALERKEQKEAWFLEMNPNGRIPVITDDDGPDGAPVTVFESGAILLYLAEKSGRFLPAAPAPRARVMEWLFFVSTHLTFGAMQVHWLARRRDAGEPHPDLEMWQAENARVYGVLDQGLAGSPYFGGEDYSIADIAAYPWVYRWRMQGIDMEAFPHLKSWFAGVGAREAVIRGLGIPPRDDDL